MKDTENEITEQAQGQDNEPLVTVEPSTVTKEQLDELKQRAAKADENWDRLLRTSADFDNYKKRAVREKQEAVKYANESLLEKLVPVLDTFDMALNATQNSGNSGMDVAKSLQTGISMVHQQLKAALLEAGLEEVDAGGKPFDPNLHQAVSQQETAELPEGMVVQQLRKGYKLKDRLIRPATVVVSKPPAGRTAS